MPANSIDVLAAELGAVAGRIERESALRIDAAISELRRVDAERELRLQKLERIVEERVASVKDGRDGIDGKDGAVGKDGRDGKDGVSIDSIDTELIDDGRTLLLKVGIGDIEHIHEIPLPAGKDGRDGADGKDGKDADPREIANLLLPEVKQFIAGDPSFKGEPGEPGEKGDPGQDGKDGLDGKDGKDGKDGAPGERGLDGKDGKDGKDGLLPVVEEWKDGVHYRGQVRAHRRGTYQALRDTAKEPPHEDWICLAAAGSDGRSPRVRETYSVEIDDYRELDIVALGGAAFIARRDNPGTCPGDGWQLIAMQGKRGQPGEKVKGDPGKAGPKVERMTIDGEGMLTLFNADGSTVECDLYPVLTKIAR